MAAFANDEAVASFRAGIGVADQEGPSNEAMARMAIALRAKLAQVFWHTGHGPATHTTLDEAIRLAGPGEALHNGPI